MDVKDEMSVVALPSSEVKRFPRLDFMTAKSEEKQGEAKIGT